MISCKSFRHHRISNYPILSVFFLKDLLIHLCSYPRFSHLIQFSLCIKYLPIVVSIFQLFSRKVFFFYSHILIFSHHSLIGIGQFKLSQFMNFFLTSFIFLIHDKIVLNFFMQHFFIVFFHRFKPCCLVNLAQDNFVCL